MKKLFVILLFAVSLNSRAQVTDSIPQPVADTALRIVNFHSNFNQHVDSTMVYQFRINKDVSQYFWFLKNAPVGLSIHKDNGTLSFRAAKNYFLSNKLKYDTPYPVQLGVQSLEDETKRVDTTFLISFYNTEIIPSKLKLSVSDPLFVDEGETVSFRIQCETGSFPFETILFNSSLPIKDYTLITQCDQEFSWTPGFDFVKDNEQAKERTVTLNFIASTRFRAKDTTTLRIIVRNALNYSQAKDEYELVTNNVRNYVLQLKYAFLVLDKRLKKTKSFRTGFDLTSAGTGLGGTILNTSGGTSGQKTGKILPGIGVALVPIKEATAPNKTVEQNQAALVRTSIKRLEYLLTDNMLVGERDNDIVRKTTRLRDELKQIQIQLIDVPLEVAEGMTEKQLNNYFNSPKVNKKYRLKRNK